MEAYQKQSVGHLNRISLCRIFLLLCGVGFALTGAVRGDEYPVYGYPYQPTQSVGVIPAGSAQYQVIGSPVLESQCVLPAVSPERIILPATQTYGVPQGVSGTTFHSFFRHRHSSFVIVGSAGLQPSVVSSPAWIVRPPISIHGSRPVTIDRPGKPEPVPVQPKPPTASSRTFSSSEIESPKKTDGSPPPVPMPEESVIVDASSDNKIVPPVPQSPANTAKKPGPAIAAATADTNEDALNTRPLPLSVDKPKPDSDQKSNLKNAGSPEPSKTEQKEREQKEREQKEREQKEREQKEREQKEREQKEREQKEREQKEREQKEREQKEREQKEKEKREREKREHEKTKRDEERREKDKQRKEQSKRRKKRPESSSAVKKMADSDQLPQPLVAWNLNGFPLKDGSAKHASAEIVSHGRLRIDSDSGLNLKDGWVQFPSSSKSVVEGIQKEKAFSIVVSLTCANESQKGPARILSCSKDTDHRNFTLGQEGKRFVIRIRSGKDDRNGTSHEKSFGKVRPGHKQLVVVTYDGKKLFCYVDGKNEGEHKFSTNFGSWERFALSAGNELTDDRKWSGTIHSMAVMPTASPKQLSQLFGK